MFQNDDRELFCKTLGPFGAAGWGQRLKVKGTQTVSIKNPDSASLAGSARKVYELVPDPPSFNELKPFDEGNYG